MTGLLASVNSLIEAKIALTNQVDIIDLKQPEKGALGALDTQTITEVVTYINGECLVSATIGDLPMQPETILQAVKTTAQTGVDFIKIGFFPGGKWHESIDALANLSKNDLKLIAVFFADQHLDNSFIPILKKAGFEGVMLDTMKKQHGSLTQVLPLEKIAEFVNITKNLKLLCGLAGSLQLFDIPSLLNLQPDYLGFRGAICLQNNRIESIDESALQKIYSSIMEYQSDVQSLLNSV